MIVWRYRKVIFWVTLITFVLSLAGSFFKTPNYEATTTILIKSNIIQSQTSVPGVTVTSDSTTLLQTKGQTFREILNSRAVAERIVNILELEKTLKKRKQNFGTFIFKGLSNLMMLKPKDPKQRLIEDIQKSISSKLITSTSIIEVSVSYPDPKLTADIANTAAKVFVDQIREMNVTEARIAKEFIAERVSVAEIDLKKTQDKFQDFISKEKFVYPEKKTEMGLNELVRFESALKTTETDIEQTDSKIKDLRQKLTKQDKNIISQTTINANPLILDFKKKQADLEIQRANMSIDYGPLHPKMVAMEEEVKKIKNQMDLEVKKIIQSEVSSINPIYQQILSDLVSKETDLIVFKEKKKVLIGIIQGFPKELVILAEKQIIWETLINAVHFAHKNLDSLKTQLEAARISEAQKISEINVVDFAIPPMNPKYPLILFPILGVLLGLMGGAGMAIFMDYLDDSIKSVENIEEELKIPVYGVIPEIKAGGQPEKRKIEENVELNHSNILKDRLITHFEPKSSVAEAYRSLRTNIQFASLHKKNRVFLFTSSLKGEGKSTTVSNLGITSAQLGNRTLLIDGDLRNPTIQTIFGLSRDPGLSNYIVGDCSLKDIIRPSGIENLDLILSGPIPPNPSELLSAENFNPLTQETLKDYDLILIDSPPVLAVTDATILSEKVNGVFLVVREGKTSKKVALNAKSILEKVNAKVIGAVLNNVKIEYRYGYSYYYYDYSYGEDGPSQKKKRKKKN